MTIARVSEKGQITIPIELRRKLGIRKDDYVSFEEDGYCLKLRKVSAVNPLAPEDPIWELVGKGSSGKSDISRRHDHYIAEAEAKRWRKS